MYKFIKMIFGPIHYQTRFLPLFDFNKETLNNYEFLIDNIKLYDAHKNDVRILDIEELRRNHEWSKEKEIIYDEIDIPKYIHGFRKYYLEQHLLPLNILRFGFKSLTDRNILNIAYVANNCYMTNKQNVIDDYFNSIPVGTIHGPLQGSPTNNCRENVVSILNDLISEEFPNLKLGGKDAYNIEMFMFGIHFKNNQDAELFYRIWDFIVKQFYIDDRGYLNNPRHNAYTRVDEIIGYIARIFEINFGYTVKYHLEYWKNDVLGLHLTSPHDTLAYGNPLSYRYFHNEDGIVTMKNIPKPYDDLSINSVSDYVKKYKDELMYYYVTNNTHCHIYLNENEDNIIIKHKNL